MLEVAKEAVGAWAPHTVHFERFAGDPVPMEEDIWDDVPFEVIAKNSGQSIHVPAHRSIASALKAAGIEVPVSCEAGFCGACLTRYLDGDPVHRDSVLSKAERKVYTLICRARSRSKILVLDL
jgi:vanillate O-demethylase ferredoxin subunit